MTSQAPSSFVGGLTVRITALGHAGDGVAEAPDGSRLHIAFALPGETVAIEDDDGQPRLKEVVVASPDRLSPACRHFGACGGCALQHMASPAYLAWKREQLLAAFAQRRIEALVLPPVAIPSHSRRRAVFTAVGTAAGVTLGFSRRGTNEILAIEECPVLVPAIMASRSPLLRLAKLVLRSGDHAHITVVAADNGLDICLARERQRPLDRGLLEPLARLAERPDWARLTIDGEEVFRNQTPEIITDGASLFPTPGGFLQASAVAAAVLGDAVETAMAGGPVADLFAGIGAFTLRLARRAPVTAVETDAASLAALDRSIRQARRRKPIRTLRRDLFRNPLSPKELDAFAGVVFDPPRAGAKAQAEAIAKSHVPRIAAVSCSPATLARDTRILLDGGYRLISVLPVDQFLWSPHVEAVATFER